MEVEDTVILRKSNSLEQWKGFVPHMRNYYNTKGIIKGFVPNKEIATARFEDKSVVGYKLWNIPLYALEVEGSRSMFKKRRKLE